MNNTAENNIVDLLAYKRKNAKKSTTQSRPSQATRSTLQSTLRGPAPIPGKNVKSMETEQDLSGRIDRIKSSIGRINQLMQELRSMSEQKSSAGKQEKKE